MVLNHHRTELGHGKSSDLAYSIASKFNSKRIEGTSDKKLSQGQIDRIDSDRTSFLLYVKVVHHARVYRLIFNQDQVVDHRIAYTCNLQSVLDGDLDPLVKALAEDYKSQRLQDIIAGISDDIDT